MKILTANSGSYPRVGDGPGQMKLREAYNDWEVQNISDEEMERVYEEYTEEVIEEQEKAGLDVVTDGLLRWYDPVSHFGKKIYGCEIDGLLRYFDTNFYYRQPVITDELRRSEQIVLEEFLSARKFASKSLKPVVTGPFTLAHLSIDEFYGGFEGLVHSFCNIIAEEVRDLSGTGVEEIQINEPAILERKEDFDIFANVFEKIANVCEEPQLDLHVYFGDSTPLYDDFQDLPVDLLNLDFTHSSNLVELIREKGSDKKLGLGLVNARNTRVEKADEIVPIIKKIEPYLECDEVYLNPSCGLEFLPREKAYEKLVKLVEIAEKAKVEVL